MSVANSFESIFDPFFLKAFRLRTTGADVAEEEYDLMMNLSETQNAYKLEAEIPGATKDMVKIDAEEHFLRIYGELPRPTDEEGEKRWIVERSYGKFDRKIRLPRNAEMDKINAKVENGLLSLTIPKAAVEKSLAKSINIQ
jgi:HSP20 family protein